mgnify:CR=1 FL=1
MTNPYATSRPHQMWRRAVSMVEPHLLDPVVAPRFQIDAGTRVATAGSCFAQHIARKIRAIGFNYHVPEDGSDLPDALRREKNFGVFSARYGNIYTVEQLLQLFEEVFEGRIRAETAWRRPDGRYVDPYRPRIEPEGYGSEDEVIAARREHLGFVERTFREAELLIFTLGLTEAWRSRIDGSVFPLAPGVSGGDYDPERHAFHNFTVGEVTASLIDFIGRLRRVNPEVRVLLTVSPVPLIATYEDRHVSTSTTYSKAVLRVAAQAAFDAFDFVDYFPSYEIITSSATGGLYYEEDHREVAEIGVAHAMRCFVRHYVAGAVVPPAAAIATDAPPPPLAGPKEVVCDEEAMDAANI